VGQVSPDGRWEWNGEAWLPRSVPVKQPLTLGQLVGLISVLVIVLMVAFVAVSGAQESDQREQDYNELVCEEYGDEDPSYCE